MTAKATTCLAFVFILQLFIIFGRRLSTIEAADADQRKIYIVYMGDAVEGVLPAKAHHLSMLKGVFRSSSDNGDASKYYVCDYNKSFNGFAANLTADEARRLSKMGDVVSVFPNKRRELLTTKSWDFMGFRADVKRNVSVESDIIVGVIDTGIWPESESFSDGGFGPPPAKWKGSCAANFTCNNKIIGAKYFQFFGPAEEEDVESPLDMEGHGTHTASTVAGGIVDEASFFGLASGTARGGVPSARIAVYKACWSYGCHDVDLLAAFDAAISDGVDVISISIGGTGADPFLEDSIAIGSFHAMRKGILTSASAGNSGPRFASVSNVAPWLLSVGASTIDRDFSNKIELGNGMVFEGRSITTFDLENKNFPLVNAEAAQNRSSSDSAPSYCSIGALNETMVKGKIVLCDTYSLGAGPFFAGAAGAIMYEDRTLDKAYMFPLPATHLDSDAGDSILSYIQTQSDPVGTITKSSESDDKSAPYVISFSSRGPNTISPDILKPDVTAPGVHILAAYSPVASVSGFKEDKRSAAFNILSGTSMACPHASAAAAYVKSFHPDWSPSAIKSALMTTAFRLKPGSNLTNLQAELAYGAGHINPTKAINPGLVYDAEYIDYINFLCKQGLNTTTMRILTRDDATCPDEETGTSSSSSWDLNYPSLAIPTNTSSPFNRSFNRIVTNVGSPYSLYTVSVNTTSAQGLTIDVEPNVLNFTSSGQKLSFKITVSGTLLSSDSVVSASMVWSDGVHEVRSPIVVYDSLFSSL